MNRIKKLITAYRYGIGLLLTIIAVILLIVLTSSCSTTKDQLKAENTMLEAQVEFYKAQSSFMSKVHAHSEQVAKNRYTDLFRKADSCFESRLKRLEKNEAQP